jgi:DNA repair exonuclease SbcCD ATPase subunit
LRILKLQASNIKRISVIEIDANRYVNRISGANGSGKTSVLDAIEWGLVGGKNVPSQPVRRGAVNAKIKIDMGETTSEVVLTRQFYEGSAKRAGRLMIEQKPGADATEFQDKRKKVLTPDELEDALLKQVSFDPLEFLRMEAKKQYHVLRRISTPDIDMDALDATIQENFDQRTVAGRKRDQLEASRNSILVPEGLPMEPKDVTAMVAELAQAGNHNTALEREAQRRARINEEIKTSLETVQRLQKELLAAEAAYESLKIIPGTWEPLAEPKDAEALAEHIEEARTINRAIERGQLRAKIDKEFIEADAEWTTLDLAVKEGERRKKEAIAHAHYPVDGLGFGNQEVMYNGFPFDQASNAEQIRVSAAIGMTTNSKVRVMRIRDGSLLDNDSLAIIAEMAHKHDFQVWIETVSETGTVGIYLEDGEVKAVNDEPLDKPPMLAAAPAKKKASKKKASR